MSTLFMNNTIEILIASEGDYYIVHYTSTQSHMTNHTNWYNSIHFFRSSIHIPYTTQYTYTLDRENTDILMFMDKYYYNILIEKLN